MWGMRLRNLHIEICSIGLTHEWSETGFFYENTLLECVDKLKNPVSLVTLASQLTLIKFSKSCHRIQSVRLKKAVLGAIEKEHPNYEQTMAEVMQEALAKSISRPAITPDEFCEWLDNVSD